MAKKGTKSPAKKKSNHLTEVLNAVNLKQPCEYKPKEFSAWVLSLFLSEDPQLINIVNRVNQYQFTLDDKLIFKYYVDVVPAKRVKDSEEDAWLWKSDDDPPRRMKTSLEKQIRAIREFGRRDILILVKLWKIEK